MVHARLRAKKLEKEQRARELKEKEDAAMALKEAQAAKKRAAKETQAAMEQAAAAQAEVNRQARLAAAEKKASEKAQLAQLVQQVKAAAKRDAEAAAAAAQREAEAAAEEQRRDEEKERLRAKEIKDAYHQQQLAELGADMDRAEEHHWRGMVWLDGVGWEWCSGCRVLHIHSFCWFSLASNAPKFSAKTTF